MRALVLHLSGVREWMRLIWPGSDPGQDVVRVLVLIAGIRGSTVILEHRREQGRGMRAILEGWVKRVITGQLKQLWILMEEAMIQKAHLDLAWCLVSRGCDIGRWVTREVWKGSHKQEPTHAHTRQMRYWEPTNKTSAILIAHPMQSSVCCNHYFLFMLYVNDYLVAGLKVACL